MDIQTAVDRIIADLSDRRGLRQEWDQIDSDVKSGIRDSWIRIMGEVLAEQKQVPNPLAQSLAEALNRHSAENGSNTPDFILADFLRDCLTAFNVAQTRRNHWYGRKDEPGKVLVVDQPGSLVELLITESLLTLSQRAQEAFEIAANRQELHDARAQALGKDGELTGILVNLGQVPADKRQKLGKIANAVRADIDRAFEAKLSTLDPV